MNRLATIILVLACIGCAHGQPCTGGMWVEIPLEGPRPSAYGLMAFDAHRGVSVFVETSGSGATWSWDGSVWANLGFLSRYPLALCYDPIRQYVLAFCWGNETWSWDGAAWTRRATSGPLSHDANGHRMAFDNHRGRVVLFGGRQYSPSCELYQETWEWSGALWVLRSPLGPNGQGRASFAMATDPATGRPVLMGGLESTGTFACNAFITAPDTWRWSGSAWHDTGEFGPAPRSEAAAATDTSRGRVVLYGGHRITPSSGNPILVHYDDTWEWDGNEWFPITNAGPGTLYNHAMAFDSKRGRVVIYGGINAANQLQHRLWEYIPLDGVDILSQPQAQTLGDGATVVLGVDAIGSGPLSYQWRFDGEPMTDSARISGSQTPVLTIIDANPNDIGHYDVLVSNPCSSIASARARVVVTAQPCPGDADGNGVINFFDISSVLASWGLACP